MLENARFQRVYCIFVCNRIENKMELLEAIENITKINGMSLQFIFISQLIRT